jgi:type I restriction enzyme R subunit
MPLSEADTCRKYVVPKLTAAGWDDTPHTIAEQRHFTDGRIYPVGNKVKRGKGKKADYLLRFQRDLTLAVVEAKSVYKTPGEGLQQAKEYAEILGLKFAYATNGHGIVEFDYTTGLETEISEFPTPNALWERLMTASAMQPSAEAPALQPTYFDQDRQLRYYQETAVNRAVQAVARGKPRILLTMATGTGKTTVAFQICWKLWSSRWNAAGEYRRPRILYLADRNHLVDDPKDKTFAPFGDARAKIAGGEITKSRQMYFAIYQAIAEDENRLGLYREYAPDFFDLIIVDECHRGSASDESNWRQILNYFDTAYQIGMTATPLREETRDTYAYFGQPLYSYSLRQGIDDGFLAPYRVHRVVTEWDAAGWRPTDGEEDRYGREVPDREYTTKDFDRVVALKARTRALAKHLTDFLASTDPYGKTIVFCVDQEHALEMRREIGNLSADLVKDHPDYVCRVTSNEGEVGRQHLSDFQELDCPTPVVLTTSQLLTTGVDAPTCRNIVLARTVGSMPEFKQIIGRGTRVRADYNKYFFNIIDYTGAATRMFADPEFDGEPSLVTEEKIDDSGAVVPGSEIVVDDEETTDVQSGDEFILDIDFDDDEGGPRKYYVDHGSVEIVANLVYELDAEGNQLRVVRYTDYTADKVRSLYRSASELKADWLDPVGRARVSDALLERGIDIDQLASATGQEDADPFDLLCNIAFSLPVRTRRERAEGLMHANSAYWSRYTPAARDVLSELIQKYVDFGTTQFALPDALEVPPISDHATLLDVVAAFGDEETLAQAVRDLQALLYAA